MQQRPPPTPQISIIQHLISAYKVWHEFLPHVRRDARYTLGIKIDNLFIETADLMYSANYASQGKKLPYLEQAARRLDLAKFFLEVLWEIKGLDGDKYIALSERLYKIGKTLGGWIRQTATKETPASN
jgi:hypothetical protein